MNARPDLTQSEIPRLLKDDEPNPQYPENLMCKSGHACRPGTRFFRVTGPVLPVDRHGVYCEQCLIIANAIARAKKESSGG